MGMVFCRGCGKEIHESALSCPHCGAPQKNSETLKLGVQAANGKSRTTAAIFAFLLGGLGGHKFYLGQVGLGILYILFCWTFIPAIVAFIEFILLLTMSDEVFNQKYGQS
jgi:TM2 domain-containing membrane protein YozV